MRKSEHSKQTSPRSESRNPIAHRSNLTSAEAVPYSSTGVGINTAEQTTAVISEVVTKIGSGKIAIEAGRQAGLLLNAIGKKLQLESLRMRMGTHKNGKKEFFLSA